MKRPPRGYELRLTDHVGNLVAAGEHQRELERAVHADRAHVALRPQHRNRKEDVALIENLNRQTFAGFGRVLRDRLPNRGFPQGEEWTEEFCRFTAEERFFQRCPETVYFAPCVR